MYIFVMTSVSGPKANSAIPGARWCSNLVPPDELPRLFVEKKITAFTCDGDARVAKIPHPDTINFKILAQCPLRSLYVRASLEPELLALRDAIYTLRKTLKSLAVRFGDWGSRGHNQAGYPYCLPKSAKKTDGDPTRVLFWKFQRAHEKLRLESLDVLFASRGMCDEERFLEVFDIDSLKHFRFSWMKVWRRAFLFPGDRQGYKSLESLTLDGDYYQDGAVPWDEFRETASRLTYLSTYRFVDGVVSHFRSLRKLAMTDHYLREQLPICDLDSICPLLEELAYYPSKVFTV